LQFANRIGKTEGLLICHKCEHTIRMPYHASVNWLLLILNVGKSDRYSLCYSGLLNTKTVVIVFCMILQVF